MGHQKRFHPLDFDDFVDLSEPEKTLSPDKKFIHIILPENGTGNGALKCKTKALKAVWAVDFRNNI